MMTTTTTLSAETLSSVLAPLTAVNQQLAVLYPGDSTIRQPVHTVYGGAHLFKSDTTVRLGHLALRALEEYAPDWITLAQALALPNAETLSLSSKGALEQAIIDNPNRMRRENPSAWLAYTIYQRVAHKLQTEAVEDFRIDFEDGFGNRPDVEEDEAAIQAARQVAKGMQDNSLSPYMGIRIKPFTLELQARSIRTLDLFISTLATETGGRLPDNFVVTLPKVTAPEQVTALVRLFELLESQTALAAEALKMEIMVETTQSIINARGECALPALVQAGRGRCIAAHFGTYDYTASCNITAAYQSMDHPSCDFARHMMKVALGSTGIWLSDGATNVMPVGPHRREKDGPPLTEEQQRKNREVVHAAWKLGYDHIRHSLKHGFYQGWDLHPAQFPIRYAACYAFFLEGLAEATERLGNFVEKAAQATLAAGNVFDDAATGQGLLNYFLRALNCRAITEEEITATGLTLAEVQSRSFAKILHGRRQKALAG